jgi:hypothetical protein
MVEPCDGHLHRKLTAMRATSRPAGRRGVPLLKGVVWRWKEVLVAK